VTLLQITREARRAGGAVALARQEFGREPASVARGVQADEVADRLDVPLEAVPLLGLLSLDGARVARADGVDEDQVGLVEDRELVVDQLEGRLGQVPIEFEHHAARTQRAEVQPDRRGAGSAVEREGDRPLGFVLHIVFGVGDKEDLRLGLLTVGFLLAVGRLFLDDHRPCGDGVLDLPSADGDAVLGLDEVVSGGGLVFLLDFGLNGSLFVHIFSTSIIIVWGNPVI